ncbi:hypothetical protein [Desulfosporosinus youngiae]|uniref:Uncharacterized protein n=1 Tax=Desulfosporosinus youngiae DSM 17734 TaxID=768710 RepID=H5Y2Q9_9FIRM|nr:hypothetical protein [Desulfosporosinus youngiae]EHQ88322.1 hypothetical protein DesyoDRAFT_1152 [Desulfosporosinus youngiae DSM 17734]
MTDIEQDVFENAYKSVLSDKQYLKYTEEAIRLGRSIMSLLGNNSSIFLEYERYVNLAEGIYLEKTYLLGMDNR